MSYLPGDPKRIAASVIRFGSRGPVRLSGIRHRSQLTVKAWEKAVQELEYLFTYIFILFWGSLNRLN